MGGMKMAEYRELILHEDTKRFVAYLVVGLADVVFAAAGKFPQLTKKQMAEKVEEILLEYKGIEND